MFDVVSIEVGEELLEPLVHYFMVLPAVFEFRQENGPALSRFFAKRREYVGGQVSFDCLAVSLVKLAGPVVRRALCAHVVARSNYLFSSFVR